VSQEHKSLRELGRSPDLYLALAVLVIAAVVAWTTYFICHGLFMGPEEPK
jgi:hypothetical protein